MFFVTVSPVRKIFYEPLVVKSSLKYCIKRPDKEWNDPVYEHRTHEELIALEIAGKEEPNEIRWAKESIAKYTKQLNECEADEYKKSLEI